MSDKKVPVAKAASESPKRSDAQTGKASKENQGVEKVAEMEPVGETNEPRTPKMQCLLDRFGGPNGVMYRFGPNMDRVLIYNPDNPSMGLSITDPLPEVAAAVSSTRGMKRNEDGVVGLDT